SLPNTPETFLLARHSPLILCQICQYWRNVAITLPFLWSSFAIAFDLRKTSTPNYVAFVKLWLQRSQNHPLSLNFLSAPAKSSDPALCLLYSQKHRWKEIVVRTDSEAFLLELLRLRPQAVPLLRKIVIGGTYPHAGTSDNMVRNLEALPHVLASLHAVQEIYWFIMPPRTIVDVNWSHLRCLRIYSRFTASECLSLMARCPRLEDVMLNDYYERFFDRHDTTSHFPMLTLCHLHTLCVQGSADIGQLLNRLTAPLLRSLEIRRPHDYTSLERFADRSSCNLNHIRLARGHMRGDISEADVLSLLHLPFLQTLQSLDLQCIVTDAIFHHLTYVPGVRCNLPSLTELSILWGQATEGVVSEMVTSRWRITRKQSSPRRLAALKFTIFETRKSDTSWHFEPVLAHTDDRDGAILRSFAEKGLRLGLSRS
ncbi:hypothetical protein H0H92_015613, partial [Tricholoma furcatifolium]